MLNTPALDKLVAQGQYTLEIVGFEGRTSMRGEQSHPITQTDLILSIASNAPFPGASTRKLDVRIAGPATTFDRTKDGELVIGACRVNGGEYELVVMATEAFLSHCLLALSTIPRSRCFLAVTTQSKVELSTEGHVFVLEAAIHTKPL